MRLKEFLNIHEAHFRSGEAKAFARICVLRGHDAFQHHGDSGVATHSPGLQNWPVEEASLGISILS